MIRAAQLVWCLGILVIALSGCGGGESTPPPEEAQTGAVAKQQISDFVASARQDPKAAKEQLDVLLESLEGYVESASGEHAETYVKIRDKAKELQSAYAASAPQSEIDAKLNELSQLANSLPSASAAPASGADAT